MPSKKPIPPPLRPATRAISAAVEREVEWHNDTVLIKILRELAEIRRLLNGGDRRP